MPEDLPHQIMPRPDARPLTTPKITPLPTGGKQAIPAAIVRTLQSRQARTLPLGKRGVRVEDGYWMGPGADATRVNMTMNNDRPIVIEPLGESIPDSIEGKIPVCLNINYPPWNNPSFRSIPLASNLTGCVPWYQVPTVLTTVQVPLGYFFVIKGISYIAYNGVQDDVIDFVMTVNGVQAARWEDALADAAQVNPADRCALAGTTHEMPLNVIADRNSVIAIQATLRGPLTLAGVDLTFPGQPILTGNCLISVILNGWAVPMREQTDGGSRPTDLGDFGNLPLIEDQGGFQI